jgi:hypothetical protein
VRAVPRADPVGFTAGRDEVLVADGGGELPFIMTGDNSDVWEVVEDKQLLPLNQPVRCWTLRTSIPIDTTGTFWNRARNPGKITLQHTDLCVVRDVDGASQLTNGTPITEYDPQGQLRVTGWQPRPAQRQHREHRRRPGVQPQRHGRQRHQPLRGHRQPGHDVGPGPDHRQHQPRDPLDPGPGRRPQQDLLLRMISSDRQVVPCDRCAKR